ncbi:hypothetical protein [Kaistia defluvii]|uniref:Uncharacterized protein n=1 Tax=Kaistia defluvii TaxID=410841 RepID=A0ABV2R497_9HYPH
MLFIQQSASAFRYERSQEKVRFSPIDHWLITLLRIGSTWTAVDGRVAENKPGMIAIRSLGQPCRGRALATTSVSLVIPVDTFSDRGGLPEAANHAVLGGQRARLLIEFISSVEESLGRLTLNDLASVRASLIEIVFNTVSHLVGPNSEKDPCSNTG